MQILNYFLLICFINLCNSFTKQINKKYCPNFISRQCSYKLNMGCDYYIDKDLCIYDFNNEILSRINLEKIKAYFWFFSVLDQDDDGYDIEHAEYIEKTLEPSMEPIAIYSNNTFIKLSFENKYKEMIEDELNIFNKTLNDVNKIIKIENRYKR